MVVPPRRAQRRPRPGACARCAVRNELARYACASCGIHFGECPQMAGDRGRVTAGDRSGQRRLAPLQRVLQRCPRQRADHPLGDAAGRVADEFLPEQLLTPQRGPQRLDGVEQHGDDVIAGMRQRRVVQRAGVLADPERLAADLEHQRLRDGVADLVGGGDAEAGVGQSGDVLVGAGERHRGMDRQRDAALLGQRRQHARCRWRPRCGRRWCPAAPPRWPPGPTPGRRARRRERRAAAVRRGRRPRRTGSTAVSGSRRCGALPRRARNRAARRPPRGRRAPAPRRARCRPDQRR